MRSLVTGGTGFVGSHLVEALLAKGDEVTCLVRDPAKLRWLAGREVRLATGDSAKNSGLAGALEGVDRVFHVAGLIKAADEAGFREGNAAGVRNVLEACLGRDLKSVVVVTSLAAVGPAAEGRVSLDSDPNRPVSAYGRSKAEAEEIVATYVKRLPVACARPVIVYGPRDENVLEIFKAVNRRLKPLVKPDQKLSLIHVRDLAEGLIAVAEKGKPGERTFLAHEATVTSRELADLIENALGVAALPVTIPEPILRVAAALAEKFSGGASILNRDKAIEMTQRAWVCDVSGTTKRLGWKARIPHSDGLAEAARWYRAAGWL